MPKLSDFAPKPLVLGTAILAGAISESLNSSASAESPANPPRNGTKVQPGTSQTQSADYVRGKEEGIELGRKLGVLERTLDEIDKSSALIDSAINRSRNGELIKDWQDHYRKIQLNQKYFRDQIKNRAIDADLAGKTLDMTVMSLEVWAKRVGEEANKLREVAPRNQAISFQDFLSNPGIENANVVMTFPEYRASQALSILTNLRIQGMPDTKESLRLLEEGWNIIADPKNKFRQGSGLGPAIAAPFNQQELGSPSLHDLQREYVERQKAKLDSKRE